jgi:hypothetical protein
MVFGVLALLGWWAVKSNEDLEVLGFPLLILGGFTCLAPLTLAVHEIGHAAAATIFGRRVYQIHIGTGAPLMAFRVKRTVVVIGRDMGAGYVIQQPIKTMSRLASIAVLAAGAAANLTAAALLMTLAGALSSWSVAAAVFISGSSLSNFATAVVGLFPGLHTINGRRWASDGRKILQLVWRRPAPVDLDLIHAAYEGEALLQAKVWDVAEAHYRDAFGRYPDQPGFLARLLHSLVLSKGCEAATTCVEEHDEFLRQERQFSETMAPLWSYAWSMAAWVLVRSPTGDLDSADTFARKALDAAPTPYLRAVQGATVIRAGDTDKGLAAILDNLCELQSPGDKLEFCDFIVAAQLETADLKASDFQSYATTCALWLRSGGEKLGRPRLPRRTYSGDKHSHILRKANCGLR